MVDTTSSSNYTRYSDHHQISPSNHHHHHPSFSSTLLDSIYRSIDLEKDHNMRINYNVSKKHDHYANASTVDNTEEEIANFRRACMIEKWMEKKATQNAVVVVARSRKDRTNSSSECGPVPVHKPKPVRTGIPAQINHRDSENNRRDRRGSGNYGDQLDLKPIKSRALKIYGDLKKIKQPISPGGKVAAFLNSIFTAGNLRKTKNGAVCRYDSPSSQKSTTNTTSCSSASSFSRSCLSKTPSSRGKSEKRTVRFFTDEKALRRGDDDRIKSAIDEEIMVRMTENNRRLEIDLLENYQKKIGEEFGEDDDDADSYASSDLFELDNLSAIGMERYGEELPVYETTHLHTNRAIANGFLL